MNPENNHPNPPSISTPAASSGDTDAGEQRHLVVLAGESLLVAEPWPGCTQKVIAYAVANVLASSRDKAMYRAQEYLLQENLLPVTAWSFESLKAMCHDLENCALDPEVQVRLNQGVRRVADELGIKAEEGW